MSDLKGVSIIELSENIDNRGSFTKVLMSTWLDINRDEFEVYITSCLPGSSRGGHYHKKAKEWFLLLDGECTLVLNDICGNKFSTIKMNGINKNLVYVPPFVAHEFFNTGKVEFKLLAISDQIYRSEDTILYKLEL
jgi:dTDP-4-dehydrorhamnose 3,5-epimerase-like enzyme